MIAAEQRTRKPGPSTERPPGLPVPGLAAERGPVGRRSRRRQATRAALLEAGLQLVKERGLFGTRVEDITERCDVAKGVFYNYFESKDALFAELLAQGVDILLEDYLGGPPSSVTRIRALVRAHDRFFDERPEYALLFHQGRGPLQLPDGGGSALQGIYRDYLGRLAAVALPADRELPPSRRLDLAALLAGAVSGYRSYRSAAGIRTPGGAAEQLLAASLPRLWRRRGRAVRGAGRRPSPERGGTS